jgi:hypothetical protein
MTYIVREYLRDMRPIHADFTPDARVTSANPTQIHLPREERA